MHSLPLTLCVCVCVVFLNVVSILATLISTEPKCLWEKERLPFFVDSCSSALFSANVIWAYETRKREHNFYFWWNAVVIRNHNCIWFWIAWNDSRLYDQHLNFSGIMARRVMNKWMSRTEEEKWRVKQSRQFPIQLT